MLMTEQSVMTQLTTTFESLLGLELPIKKMLKSMTLQRNHADVEMRIGFPIAAIEQSLTHELTEHHITVRFEQKIQSHAVQPGIAALPDVKNIIAVASGKGGVGKSTTCVNLALALAQMGAKVGILDADIHGPNQPQMLGVHEKPDIQENKRFKPVERYGVQSNSFGYLVDKNTPMVWRGPMVSSALQQLATLTDWQDLDYLFVDMPPGTGDIQLTLAKKIPVSGAVIVTTPQDVALLDARKGLEMFNKVNIPVMGLIENMSTHICSACGHEEAIFGAGGGEQLSADCDTPLLGQLPLDLSIRKNADAGKPTVVAEPDSELANKYKIIALKLAARLSTQPRNFMAKMPGVVVE